MRWYVIYDCVRHLQYHKDSRGTDTCTAVTQWNGRQGQVKKHADYCGLQHVSEGSRKAVRSSCYFHKSLPSIVRNLWVCFKIETICNENGTLKIPNPIY